MKKFITLTSGSGQEISFAVDQIAVIRATSQQQTKSIIKMVGFPDVEWDVQEYPSTIRSLINAAQEGS